MQRGFDPTVRKRYVQALIELGDLAAAEELACTAIPEARALNTQQAFSELGEFQGQLGRIAKQRFVQSHDLDQLDLAIERYATRFREGGRSYFHGINVVALVAAMTRLNTDAVIAKDIQLPALAKSVLAEALEKLPDDPSPWPLATISEAYLAMKRGVTMLSFGFIVIFYTPRHRPSTLKVARASFARSGGGDALRNSTCADRLSAIIDRHVLRTQNRWLMSTDMLKTAKSDPTSLEKNFSGERIFTVDIIRKMLERCAGIGCVIDSESRRVGTGFIVSASALGLGDGGDLVFITNAHVVGNSVAKAIAPPAAWVTFELECAAEGRQISHKVMPDVLFTSPPGKLGRTYGGPPGRCRAQVRDMARESRRVARQ